MTVKELASKMNELMRDGHSNTHIFMTLDGKISTPIKDIYIPASVPMVIISSA